MHEITADVPRQFADELALFRYRERFGLSYNEAMNEPAEEIERALLIWSLDAQRDKLESERQKMRSSASQP